MAGIQLSAEEQQFVQLHGRQVTDILEDLVSYHRGLRARGHYLVRGDNRIIAKLRPLVGGIEDDIETALISPRLLSGNVAGSEG